MTEKAGHDKKIVYTELLIGLYIFFLERNMQTKNVNESFVNKCQYFFFIVARGFLQCIIT